MRLREFIRRITPRNTALLLFLLVCAALAYTFRPVQATEVTATTQQLLNGATTGSASVGAGFMPRCRETAIYLQWGAGTNAGTIVVETAHDVNFSGTWAQLASKAWSAASTEDVIQITGIHSAIRTRISSNITGGTVNTWLVCN